MRRFLKDIIEDEGISQAALSRESGVSTTTINKICTKNLNSKISPTTKGKITKALNKLTSGRQFKVTDIKFD